jgi:hypothetical protein
MAVFLLNLVFMNFIIAVISESFGKVMTRLVPETYKVKAEMIAERELHMTKADFLNATLFPKYILLRRIASLLNSGD